ncbi:30S ribosome-binding factor RbfA [bacterium]|nr:30S ribosome-binding factor RbfA [bacterium]
MPDDIRMKRIEAFFREELARLVSRELRDPIFESKIISFSEIDVSRDLSNANVRVTVLGDESRLTEIVKALNAATSFIRSEIMKVSDFRKVPKFRFHEDRTIETASKIESILDTLDIPPGEDGGLKGSD